MGFQRKEGTIPSIHDVGWSWFENRAGWDSSTSDLSVFQGSHYPTIFMRDGKIGIGKNYAPFYDGSIPPNFNFIIGRPSNFSYLLPGFGTAYANDFHCTLGLGSTDTRVIDSWQVVHSPTVARYHLISVPQPSPSASVTPSPTPFPTPVPTPKPTPRLPRYYSATSWVARNGATANIIGAVAAMNHVPLTATDKVRGGVAGEVMWAKGQPGDWIEVGYSDRPSTSQSVFGKCFYWANANEAIGRYQDYRISDDSDATGDKRAYRVQRRVVNLGGTQYRLLYQVFQSDKNNTTAWKVVGLAGLFNEPILATDHGLEVTAKNRGTIGSNALCQIDGIMHLISGQWWAVNGTSYNVVPAQPDGTPVFKTIHNFADVRPTNNMTINYEVP